MHCLFRSMHRVQGVLFRIAGNLSVLSLPLFESRTRYDFFRPNGKWGRTVKPSRGLLLVVGALCGAAMDGEPQPLFLMFELRGNVCCFCRVATRVSALM